MDTAVVMLSKSPTVDRCKTRLTDVLNQQQANDLQSALIQDIFQHITLKLDHHFWVAAPSSKSLTYFHPFFPRLLLQSGNDLGEKMKGLTHRLFSSGYNKVVLIGSDMPLMTSQLIDEAFNKLGVHDCVIGPATDGGYYLIGFRRPIDEVFHGIEWSTSSVLNDTLCILDKTGSSYALLAEHRDIDSWSDILFYANETIWVDQLPNTFNWIQSHVQIKTS